MTSRDRTISSRSLAGSQLLSTHAAGAAMLVWAIMGRTTSSLFLLPAELLPASLNGDAMIVLASFLNIIHRFLWIDAWSNSQLWYV
jgi:hypothetical protein